MDEIDTRTFLKEREDKIEAHIIWKTYSTFFAEISGEKREYGVFAYSEGKNFYLEDFERVPSIMGIALPSKRKKEEYIKLEISFPLSDIESIALVTRSSADASLKRMEDISRVPSLFGWLLRKTVTKIKLKNGRVFFFELMSHKDFSKWVHSIIDCKGE